ncbi:hypothetical protein C9F11_37630 [Streptomyces sp. YIM 121038]|uniref:HNH endonuclease signature motif containing protein n=1 Tax=Streptomyces sp. YIM 121038 TaxID=2136401 RepID=UPI0011631C85|nr:HNH endonuclease signature motif containing protein [Streptomyces sp. YIM 121038]QCX81109.1 hypothetical protein C9F11_37630 [Streptomyces sp. YIM 121038]
MTTCSVPDCGKKHHAHGYCGGHAKNWRRHGVAVLPKPTLIERVMAKVDKSGPVSPERPELGPCWIWTGYRMPFGHGQVKRGSGLGGALVHRVVYEHAVGEVPAGLELDHLCRVPACCNPKHLEPVTHAENVRRGIAVQRRRETAAAKTHCPSGHPYSGANLRITPLGTRRCKACQREWGQRKTAANRAVTK